MKEKNPHAVALGRLGGKVGGDARALKLSAKRRSQIARKAAKARWALRDQIRKSHELYLNGQTRPVEEFINELENTSSKQRK